MGTAESEQIHLRASVTIACLRGVPESIITQRQARQSASTHVRSNRRVEEGMHTLQRCSRLLPKNNHSNNNNRAPEQLIQHKSQRS